MVAKFREKTFRALRKASHIRGWKNVSRIVAGPRDSTVEVDAQAYGRQMRLDLSSWVEWNIYMFGGYEVSRINAFKALCNRSGALLDVGANVGNHSLAMSGYFPEVHAFEPNPRVYDRLKQNIRLNGNVGITAVNAGLGETPAELVFYAPDESCLNQGNGTFVKAEAVQPYRRQTLPIYNGDNYVSGAVQLPVSAIKMDVQGFEPMVLRGLEGTINRDRPVIWLEATASTRKGLAEGLPLTYAFNTFRFKRPRFTTNEFLSPSSTEEMLRRDGDYVLLPTH